MPVWADDEDMGEMEVAQMLTDLGKYESERVMYVHPGEAGAAFCDVYVGTLRVGWFNAAVVSKEACTFILNRAAKDTERNGTEKQA